MPKNNLILLALLLIGVSYLLTGPAACAKPLRYHISEIDQRFDISQQEVRTIITQSEEAWERAYGTGLFELTENSGVPIYFRYDERQQRSIQEKAVRQEIDTLRTEFNLRRENYITRLEAYESRLGNYNDSVDFYNANGGAPSGDFERLQNEKASLNNEQGELSRIAASLSTEQNSLNKRIEEYNKTFGDFGSFDQGDYTYSLYNKAINIYQYNSFDDLRLVLVHELGHARGFEHVENEESIMYPTLAKQDTKNLRFSAEDLAEAERACSLPPWQRYAQAAKGLLN